MPSRTTHCPAPCSSPSATNRGPRHAAPSTPSQREAADVDAQLLIVTANPDLPLDRLYPEAKTIVVPGASVFELRRRGLEVATGDVVCVTEDHAIVPEGWASSLVAALGARPDVDLAPPVLENGARDGRTVDWANFLIWFARFMAPMGRRHGCDRRPPTTWPFAGSALRSSTSREGTFEPASSVARGSRAEVVVVDDLVVTHDQSLGPVFTYVHAYYNGRSASGFTTRETGARRGFHPSHLLRHYRSLIGTARAGTRDHPELRSVVRRAMPAIMALAVCHTVGVGVAETTARAAPRTTSAEAQSVTGADLVVASVATRSHLASARVMTASLLEQHPRASVTVVVIDWISGPPPSLGDGVVVWGPDRLGLTREEIDIQRAMYDQLELSCSVKPLMLRRLLDEGTPAAMWIDADMRVLGSLDDLAGLAVEHGIGRHAALPGGALHVDDRTPPDRALPDLRRVQHRVLRGGRQRAAVPRLVGGAPRPPLPRRPGQRG